MQTVLFFFNNRIRHVSRRTPWSGSDWIKIARGYVIVVKAFWVMQFYHRIAKRYTNLISLGSFNIYIYVIIYFIISIMYLVCSLYCVFQRYILLYILYNYLYSVLSQPFLILFFLLSIFLLIFICLIQCLGAYLLFPCNAWLTGCCNT